MHSHTPCASSGVRVMMLTRCNFTQFDLDALDEVKTEIVIKRQQQQQQSPPVGGGVSFMSSAVHTPPAELADYSFASGRQQGPTDGFPGPAGPRSVSVSDLNWEEKEKVLRLLFAKMKGSV